MSLYAACTKCNYRELIDDDLPGLEALDLAGVLARDHALREHFELITPTRDTPKHSR